MFFESTGNETDRLYVSFDGRTFWKLGEPYTHTAPNTAFRDPGLMYYEGKWWILNGLVNHNSIPYKYQLKWGVSTDLQNWSPILYGNSGSKNNPISLACNVGGQIKYPYDANANMVNKTFEAMAPDPFIDGDDVYVLLSAGYFGESHEGTGEDDVMKQYLVKVTNLSLDTGGNLHADYGNAQMLNFPRLDKDKLKDELYDERNEHRGGNDSLYMEDRLDGSIYKENGYYYFVVKRFGTSYELWRIANLNNVSNESSWELINSDFVYEHEGDLC